MYPWTEERNLLENDLQRLRSGLGGLLSTSSDIHGSCTAPPWAEHSLFLPLNVRETADAVTITAELPGLRKEDMAIGIDGDVLTIKGRRRPDLIAGEAGCHRRERGRGYFERSVSLPVKVDADNVEATYRNGVLSVRLPKGKPARRKRIEVGTE